MPTKPSRTLETFDNPHPERDYVIEITMPEFTCLCPKTGQPDFATLYLDYVADRKCVELKALKLYVWSYRNEGAFHEAVTNQILSDLVAATDPRYLRLRAEFYVRGGIYTSVTVEHRKPGWQPRENLSLPKRTTAIPTPTRAPARPRATGAGEQAAEPKPEPEPARTPGGPDNDDALYVGIDIGTSAATAVAIDATGKVLAQETSSIPPPLRNEAQVTQDPTLWWQALVSAMDALAKKIEGQRVRAIAVDGTSGTILLTDAKAAPITPGLMYNDARALAQADAIAELAGPRSGAHGASSGLAKLLWLHERGLTRKSAHCLHQTDWITAKLTGIVGISDHNNALKLGYDCEQEEWPSWLRSSDIARLLPKVQAPGIPIAPLGKDLMKRWRFPNAYVVSGTTDGVASFIAAGARTVGEAVTSLGSTLVLKLLSDQPVYAREYGVYSHRLGDAWLVGGASNAGGAALRQFFDVAQMEQMTPRLQPDQPTGLRYYPLPAVGERFPVNDPNLQPKTEPLPGDSVTFFQGLLEGIARIEAEGYALLAKLGAPRVTAVMTTGGGAGNPGWQRIRERALGVPVVAPRSQLAAFGSALLAARG